MKEVTINKIVDNPVELYSPLNILIGVIDNLLTFNDVRIQIAKQRLTGYFIMFNNKRININEFGVCDSYPKGFFDTEEHQLADLFRQQINK